MIFEGDARDFKPEQKYKVIYADPPWHWETRSDKGRIKTPDVHYPCMTLEDMKQIPVKDWADKDCALFMWVIDAYLEKSFELIDAWGFKFKTVGFYWAKTTTSGKWFFGQGYWTRGNPEQCLLATKGSPKRQSKAVRKLLVADKGPHSAKPAETRQRIMDLVPGPYLEMFARTQVEGWDSVGIDVNKNIFI
jgi:N6-adenosine-specific RNA methylase IME4